MTDDTTLEEIVKDAALAAGFEVRPNGALVIHGTIIGALEFTENGPVIRLNLGWLRLAGVGIIAEDDPAVDNHRGGNALERLP